MSIGVHVMLRTGYHRQGGHAFAFVCLSVCPQNKSKRCGRISILNIFGGVGCVTNWLDFGGDPHRDSDSGDLNL